MHKVLLLLLGLRDVIRVLVRRSGVRVVSSVTALIPWDGRNEEWLMDALASLQVGTPFLVAKNNGKLEMASALNGALEDVETEYVFVMGADDLAGPDMIETLLAGIG